MNRIEAVLARSKFVDEPHLRDVIRWDRLGLDATSGGTVGACIRWVQSPGPYVFSRAEYERCLAAFRPTAG